MGNESRKIGIHVTAAHKAAMVAANNASGSNPFATIADLALFGDDGIYGPSDSLTVDHTTTLGLFDWNIDIDVPSTGRLRIGRVGQTAIRPIHFFTPDTAPVRFSGFNGSNNTAAVEIGNTDHSIVAATFYNDGDVVLGDVGAAAGSATTGRGRVTIGVTAPINDYKLQIKGIDDGPGRGTLVLYNSSSQLVAQFTNDRRVGIGALGGTHVTFNVRSLTSGSSDFALQIEDSGTNPIFQVRDDGVSFSSDMVIGSFSQSAAASKLEVTGNVETIGSANGHIFESPNTQRWQMKVDNFGSPTFVPLP